ncbi:hypothetical protein LCGC14_1415910 [marine sediment metagenome]|uniref:Uncharacterized protein n=1 Tax=marine sediment metagenome TaxID=412755 RepID=A0A0F9JSW9_9ZZZZ
MPDITHDQVVDTMHTALDAVAGLEPDRLVHGNREASWTRTQRNWRLDPQGPLDTGQYRNKIHMRVTEEMILHLTHKAAADPSRSEDQASRDAQSVIQSVISNDDFLTLGVRTALTDIDVNESDSGDHIETDITFELTYDISLTLSAG